MAQGGGARNQDIRERKIIQDTFFLRVSPYMQLTTSSLLHRLLGEKRQELLDQANKLRTGLFKIDETREKVEVMSLELEDAKKKVAEFQKQCEEYLVIIVQQKREADEQQKVTGPSLVFLFFLLTSPMAPTSAQHRQTVDFLFISRLSPPIARRSLLRRSSVRHWPTMPRRI